jgi:undecaprenyl-diphosphatase
MSILQAVILGIIEGITEFLPVSSTGHLILAGHLMGLEFTEFYKTFEIAIQLGAIASVVFLYRRFFVSFKIWLKLGFAFLPTGVAGFFFYPYVKGYLLGSPSIVVWSLAVGGLVIILFERTYGRREPVTLQTSDISTKQALAVGAFQAVSMIPGVSRSAATILGGLFMKIERKTIVEFSFLLAVPTMVVATGYDLFHEAGSFTQQQINLLAVGFLVSFAVAALAIKWLLKYVQKHDFTAFGVYRILVAVLFWLAIL